MALPPVGNQNPPPITNDEDREDKPADNGGESANHDDAQPSAPPGSGAPPITNSDALAWIAQLGKNPASAPPDGAHGGADAGSQPKTDTSKADSHPAQAPASSTKPSSDSGGVLGWISHTASKVSSAVKGAAKQAADDVSSAAKSVGQGIVDIDKAIGKGAEAIDSAVSSAEEHVDSVRNWISKNGGPGGEVLAAEIGVGEGIAKSGYDMAKGLVQMGYGAAQLANPVEWIANKQANEDRLAATANAVEGMAKLANLANPWASDPQGNAQMRSALWNSAVTSFEKDPAKFVGNAIGTVGSFFIPGGGEAGAATKATELAADASKVTRAGADASKVANAAGDGVKVATEGADASKVATAGKDARSGIDLSKDTVFSGHGNYSPHNGDFVVPNGTSITLYSEHGASISDGLGNVIETGGDVSKVFKQTYEAGSRIPDYTLSKPTGLAIQGSPVTVSKPTQLSDLVKEGMGNCHWAACTFEHGSPNASLIFDKQGVIDQATGKAVKIYRESATEAGASGATDAAKAQGGAEAATRSALSHFDSLASSVSRDVDKFSADFEKELNSPTASALSKASNGIKDHLQGSDITAAKQELAGKVVAFKTSAGRPFDHVDEVTSTLKGVNRAINRLKSDLGSSSMTPELRAATEQMVSKLSSLKDSITHYLYP